MLPIKGICAIPIVLAGGLNYYYYYYSYIITFILMLKCSPNHIIHDSYFQILSNTPIQILSGVIN